jgi:hypothetical protein
MTISEFLEKYTVADFVRSWLTEVNDHHKKIFCGNRTMSYAWSTCEDVSCLLSLHSSVMPDVSLYVRFAEEMVELIHKIDGVPGLSYTREYCERVRESASRGNRAQTVAREAWVCADSVYRLYYRSSDDVGQTRQKKCDIFRKMANVSMFED